jgi:hypothetical protein
MKDIVITYDSFWIFFIFDNVRFYFIIRHQNSSTELWGHIELLHHSIHVTDTSQVIKSNIPMDWFGFAVRWISIFLTWWNDFKQFRNWFFEESFNVIFGSNAQSWQQLISSFSTILGLSFNIINRKCINIFVTFLIIFNLCKFCLAIEQTLVKYYLNQWVIKNFKLRINNEYFIDKS